MRFFQQKIINRIIFLFPFFILGILLLLSFFCHPTAEDLAINYYNGTKGLEGNIRDFYFNDSSRFFSFPLNFILFDGNFINTHYYLVPISLFLLLWFSCYYFLSVVSAYSITYKVKKSILAWLASLLVVTFSTVAFEPATIFYWISGSVTYLPSYILFLLLGAQVVKIFNHQKKTFQRYFFSIICAACISGSNEISLCFLFSFLIGCHIIYYQLNKNLSLFFSLLIGIVLICVFFLIIPAGSGKRAHNFGAAFSFSNGIITAFLYTLRTVYKVLSAPFVWITVAIAWIAGQDSGAVIRNAIIRSRIKPFYAFIFCITVAFLFYFLIYFLSGELLPPRANNLMAFYILSFILLTAFLLGTKYADTTFLPRVRKMPFIAGTGLLVVFFTSTIFTDSIQNIFTGYIYNKIMNERETSIKQALQSGQNLVVLLPYETDFKKYAEKKDPFTRKIIEKLGMYPRLIHYFDPVADTSFYIHYYAAYKNIDTIEYYGIKYARTGFLNQVP